MVFLDTAQRLRVICIDNLYNTPVINSLSCLVKISSLIRQKDVCISAGKKCSFFGKLGVLYFLVTLVLKLALLPYYRRFVVVNPFHTCGLFLQPLKILENHLVFFVVFREYRKWPVAWNGLNDRKCWYQLTQQFCIPLFITAVYCSKKKEF